MRSCECAQGLRQGEYRNIEIQKDICYVQALKRHSHDVVKRVLFGNGEGDQSESAHSAEITCSR